MFLTDAALKKGIEIPQSGTWPKSVHELDELSFWAVNAALASERPLLLRGRPGTGKSQLARAVAVALGRVFIPVVVNARMESQDLLFEYDAVKRLADAQTAALSAKEKGAAKQALDDLNIENYIAPKAMWWGFDWTSAAAMKCQNQPPEAAGTGKHENGAVILIDEIDKADVDLPNGLLEVLGNGGFTVPMIGRAINATGPFPLVVVTTNEDRDLPPAFLRRCLIHRLQLPRNPDELKKLLVRRGKLHFKKMHQTILQEAADMLIEDRETASDPHCLPGQAEFLDVLRALSKLGEDRDKQREVLKKIRAYSFSKHTQHIDAP